MRNELFNFSVRAISPTVAVGKLRQPLSANLASATLGRLKGVICGALVFLGLTALHGTPVQTQLFTLLPGWNAIYLEVAPADPTLSAVFRGIPIQSVWTFQSPVSAVEYIQDPKETIWNKSSWLTFVPADRTESFQNNLFTLQANRAYLVNLTNLTPCVLSVTGRPALRVIAWAPDAYNLRGFPVDAAAPPTFENFFKPSPAHYDTAQRALQNIYRLNAFGQWELVKLTDRLTRGVAYWVFTKGASDYQGPLGLVTSQSDGLDYADTAESLWLKVSNGSSTAATVRFQDQIAPPLNALSYANMDPVNGLMWIHLLTNPPAPLTLKLAAGESRNLRLAVRRADFAAETYETVLSVADGAGTQYLVPVSARKLLASATSQASQASRSRAKLTSAVVTDSPAAHAGLWVGTAKIDAVAEANSAAPATPTATKAEFNLRLIIHVDQNGIARLLKEVIQMWQDGTYTNDASGALVVAEPGHYVLVTDETKISQFKGVGLRDGSPVGRRISTAGLDFPSTVSSNYLIMDGAFAINNSLSATLKLEPGFATNPFKHKYHPDHDNMDAEFKNYKEEAYAITRLLSLQFTPVDPTGQAALDYGYNTLAGTYQEVVSGLHKANLVASGKFRLTRICNINALNQ
jgi:hypothetical protein